MRQQFFIIVGIVVAVGAVLFFLWAVARSLYGMFADYRMQGSLNELADSHADRRRRLREEERNRLQNGCDHVFGDLLGALPPDACQKCGLSRQRPAGDCDHVWRRVPGAIPGSRCEKCGQLHGAISRISAEE